MTEQRRLLAEGVHDHAFHGGEAEIGRERHPDRGEVGRRQRMEGRRVGRARPGITRPSSDTIAESSIARSGTLRAIGPLLASGIQPWPRISPGTTPGEGRKPHTPQNAAGLRRLPPVSDPVAIGTMPQASATADPPEDPAAERAGSNGLPVAPQTALRVLAPAPNSGTLVLPHTMAPARRKSATNRSSSGAMVSR